MMGSEQAMRNFTVTTCSFIRDNFPQGEHHPSAVLAYLSTIITSVLSGFCSSEDELQSTVRYFAHVLQAMPTECYHVEEEER